MQTRDLSYTRKIARKIEPFAHNLARMKLFSLECNNTSVKIYRTKKLNNGSRVTGSAI